MIGPSFRIAQRARLDQIDWFTKGPGRLVLVAATLLFGAFALWLLYLTVTANGWGFDERIYYDRTTDFLAGRGFYLPRQLAGPYIVENGDSLYPPPLLLLLVPFHFLPAPLWYIVPLGITAAVTVYHRPALWGWALIAAIPVWNHYLRFEIDKGNPGIWALAFLSLGTVRPFFSPFVAFKAGLVPFALWGIWRREWWLGAAVALAINLAFLPLWFDFAHAMLDAQRDGALDYMVGEWPMMCIPIIAAISGRWWRVR